MGNALYSDLDRGDGICKFLDGNVCSIYNTRPAKCRVDKCYELYFSDRLTKEEFYKLNYQICKVLKKED